MRKAHIKTFGCQMNLYDTEVMKTALSGIGYEFTPHEEEADLILLNTCSVREKAQKRVHGLVGDLARFKRQNPNLILGVCGCVAEHEGTDLTDRFSQLDLVLSARQTARIAECVRRIEMGERPIVEVGGEWITPEMPVVAPARPGLSAWLTIIHGCSHRCTYCVVPSTRGPEISRPAGSILEDIRRLADEGYKEVTLLGQNIDAYGKHPDEGVRFIDLLERIDALALIPRVRFTTSHPADLGDEFIERFGALKTVCPYIHLPVQSGSNAVLKRMARGYTRERYLEIIERLRANIPDLALAGDIITGFPGETEDDFKQTLDILKKSRYANAFLFAYSERSGTAAVKLPDAVPPEIRNRRLREAIALQQEISREVFSELVGTTQEVLVESTSPKSEKDVTGRTRSNMTVVFPGDKKMIGREINVLINEAGSYTLFGTAVLD